MDILGLGVRERKFISADCSQNAAALTHSILKMPGGTYLGYSRHLDTMSICCSFMNSKLTILCSDDQRTVTDFSSM